jgi:hypothetical protein
MSPKAEQRLRAIAGWTLTASAVALAGVLIVGSLRFGPLWPQCRTDVVTRVDLPSSPWVIEQTIWSCSAVHIGGVQIVARDASRTIALAELGELVDVDLEPLGAGRVAITMPDPNDPEFSAFYLFRREPICEVDGLTVEYRFRSRLGGSPRPYHCDGNLSH